MKILKILLSENKHKVNTKQILYVWVYYYCVGALILCVCINTVWVH